MTKRQLIKKYRDIMNTPEEVDVSMLNESIDNYLIPMNKLGIEFKDKRCLDIGSNIGSFSVIALDNGCSHVSSYECDSRNYSILKENVEKFNGKSFNPVLAAVSGRECDTIKLFKRDSKKNHCSTSIINNVGSRRTLYDEVKNVNIKKLLNQEERWDIVKIDIEGAEYEILEEVIAYRPQYLFIELHVTKKNTETVDYFLNKLKETYDNNLIEEIIVFNNLGGLDCFFY